MMPMQHSYAAGVPIVFTFLNTEVKSTLSVLKNGDQDNLNRSLDTKVSKVEGASMKAKGTESLHH